MSAIRFQSGYACTVSVRGNERAWFGVYCNELMTRSLKHTMWDSEERPSVWRRILKDTYLADYKVVNMFDAFGNTLSEWLMVSGKKFMVGDVEIDPVCVALNTAIVAGSDPVVLGARLHGQCEAHAYVEGKNREWLADVIRHGRKIGFLRKDMGWESVVELLEIDEDSPIVTSYSVTESFPNRWIAGLRQDSDEEAWYDLSHEEQWDMAMKKLGENEFLEMGPDDANWHDFRFDNGINAFQLQEMLEDYKGE